MKTVLITGANKSIGFETARQLAAQGYFIYLGSRDIQKGEEAAARLKAEGLTQVEAIAIDVRNPATIEAARDIVARKSGSLDVLINNAGISGGFPQTAVSTPTATIREVFDTNFFGIIDVTHSFLELLKQAPEPRIVNVTSGLGSLTLHSDPTHPFYPIKSAGYGPSKTALNAYTVVLAYELRDTAFKVNTIDPGHTGTDFNHHRGPGSVERAARIIVRFATIGADGPNGKFYSNDYKEGSEECPW